MNGGMGQETSKKPTADSYDHLQHALTTILLNQTGATNRHTHTQTEMVANAFINTPSSEGR